MEIITSKNNPKISFAYKLKDKKFRQINNKILLESKKVIDEAVKSGITLDYVLSVNKEDEKLFDCEFVLIDEKISKHLSFMVTSQNIFAVCSINSKTNYELGNKILILDKIQNPDNLGAIIRTAVATGFKDIFAINSVDIYNDKCIRSSMGNIFKINYINSTYDDILKLKNTYKIVIADMNGENVFNAKLNFKKIALVLGNEGNGISDEIKKLSDITISIPMQNNVESLNVSVSAGILMYQIKNNIGD